jgi:membrane protease subunit (stomatin/prohibitin family)
MSFIKSQLIDVIEWMDDSNDTLVYRFPDEDHEIKMGAKLTVRPGQAAIFVNEGQIADVYNPGLYTLSTQNMPLLTTLKSWKHGFNSPFKAEIYYVNTKQFTDMKWGTKNPITLRDADFGVVRLRAFGTYAIQVVEPRTFFEKLVGTDGHFTTDEIEGQLKSIVLRSFTVALGKAKVPMLDLQAMYDEIGDQIRGKMEPEFLEYGLGLPKFIIENINLPPELTKAIDTRGAMSTIGDMQQFTQFQAAHAMREGASVPGSGAGQAMGLGAGFAFGNMMMGNMAQAQQAPAQQSPFAPTGAGMAPGAVAAAAPAGVPCPKCNAPVAPGAKFCSGCGQPMASGSHPCSKCNAEVKDGTKFCSSCGTPQG